MYFSFPHSTTLNQCLWLFSYNEGAKNNKGEKTKSVKDPNSEPAPPQMSSAGHKIPTFLFHP